MNTFHLQEDMRTRTLHANFTDHAVDSIGSVLAHVLGDRILARGAGRSTQRGTIVNTQPTLPDADPEDDEGSSQQEHPEQKQLEAPAHSGPRGSHDRDLLRQVFQHQGEVLQLDEPRLKADSKLDYARRLAFLFVYAHEQEGRHQTSRAALHAILHKVLDDNTKKLLRTHSGFERDGEMFRLNKQGRDLAKNALKRIFDTMVEGSGWMPDKPTAGKSSKDADATEKGKATSTSKRGPKASGKPAEWARAWNGSHGSIDAHNILAKRSLAEKGICGLWAIRKADAVGGKVVSDTLLGRFILEAFELKVDARNLGRALQSDAAAGKVIKLPGGFQLQPPGVKFSEELIGKK